MPKTAYFPYVFGGRPIKQSVCTGLNRQSAPGGSTAYVSAQNVCLLFCLFKVCVSYRFLFMFLFSLIMFYEFCLRLTVILTYLNLFRLCVVFSSV